MSNISNVFPFKTKTLFLPFPLCTLFIYLAFVIKSILFPFHHDFLFLFYVLFQFTLLIWRGFAIRPINTSFLHLRSFESNVGLPSVTTLEIYVFKGRYVLIWGVDILNRNAAWHFHEYFDRKIKHCLAFLPSYYLCSFLSSPFLKIICSAFLLQAFEWFFVFYFSS